MTNVEDLTNGRAKIVLCKKHKKFHGLFELMVASSCEECKVVDL